MVTKLKIAIIAVVAIAAIIGITLGIVYGTRSDDDDTSCDRLNAPILELTVIDDRLLARWTKPDNLKDCSVTYNLKYTIDGGTQVSKELEETQFKFDDLELEPCTEVVVILTAVNIDGDSSNPARETFTKGVEPEFGSVSGLSVILTEGNQVSVRWIGPTGFEECTMKYKVTIGESEPTIVVEQQYTGSVQYCTTTIISVVPVIDDVDGKPEEQDITPNAVIPGFAGVEDWSISILQDKQVLVEWTPLIGFDNCELMYKVSYGTMIIILAELEYTITVEYCALTTISVVPVIDGVEGIPTETGVTVGVLDGFAEVSYLVTTIEAKDVSATWLRPIGFDQCTMKYKVTVDDDTPAIIDELEYTISVDYCVPTIIEVVPVIDDVYGIPKTGSRVVVGPGSIGQVSALATGVQANTFKATWGKPAGLERCLLQYYVELKQGSNSIASTTIEDTVEWDVDVGAYCPGDAMAFTISANYDSFVGDESSATQMCSV